MKKPKLSKRGSALAASLVISACVGLVVGSTTKVANSERRHNVDAELFLEARNAAEAVVEFGFADLSKRFDSKNAFPANALAPTPGGTPLRLPSSFYTLFAGGDGRSESNVILPPNPYNGFATWGSQETELIGGTVPPGEWKFISSKAPGNEFDPLKDKWVFIREVKVYGKATVDGPTGTKTAYASQELQVRDAPLFAHAIFYNMDMEIAPGPPMEVVGGVHANGDMYIQSNESLKFLQNVSAVGDIFHGPSPGHGKSLASGNVSFPNGNGVQTSMKSGGWIDSRLSDWRSTASNRWSGNVQDAAHGIQGHNPVALKPYKRDDPNTGALDDQLNYAYQLIMPLDKTGTIDRAVEEQKFHYKAGLVIKVNASSSAINGVQFYTLSRDADGQVRYSGNQPQTIPLNTVSDIYEIKSFKDNRAGETLQVLDINMGKLRDKVHANSASDWGVEPAKWWNGVVYIEFPLDSSKNPPTHADTDHVRPSYKRLAVRLKNARSTSNKPGIPDPAYPSPSVYSFAAPRGTTIATNQQLYVWGDYNADGNLGSGSPTQPDNGNEPPAAIAADAITILSNNWSDANHLKSLDQRIASHTEISAAFLTGLVPSDDANNNAYSGGVENFPRFLEHWNRNGKKTLQYRGSMVALFESEVATGKWGQSNVYEAPGREWGFNKLFGEGLYPPGTPNTRTYRRINFRHLTEQEWNTQINALKQTMGI